MTCRFPVTPVDRNGERVPCGESELANWELCGPCLADRAAALIDLLRVER